MSGDEEKVTADRAADAADEDDDKDDSADDENQGDASDGETGDNEDADDAEANDGAADNEDSQHPAQSTTPTSQRYPYPPEGYYPPGYPHPHPPPGEGGAYPPREGYGGPHPYGMPPHMGGYAVYPYHQPPMYPHYPGYPPPPMYGYPPPEGYHNEPPGAGVGPYGAHGPGSEDGEGKDDDGKKHHNPVMPSALGSAARLKTYIKPRIASTQDVVDRRSRKNAQSRARAAKLRERIVLIEAKPASERNEEERQIFAQYEARRQRKNDRSRERAMEKKEEIDRILAKPEKKRSKIEKQFLEGALGSKKRKNEGDRMRRQRLKEMGLSSKSLGLKPGIPARGPMGYRPMPHHGYGPMGEIPMSPMPHMGHHHGMQSPGGYPGGSPGGMMGFGSPQHARRPDPAAGPGVLETPGRPAAGSQLPFIPPTQAYEGHGPPGPSRVEHRRHPDGSMSISIGGGEGGDPAYGAEAGAQEGGEMSDMLLYNDGQEGGARGRNSGSPKDG